MKKRASTVREDCVMCGRLPRFDLREVGLADGLAGLGLNALHQLLLSEGAIEAAEGAFDFAEVADFFSQGHKGQINMSDRDNNIAI